MAHLSLPLWRHWSSCSWERLWGGKSADPNLRFWTERFRWGQVFPSRLTELTEVGRTELSRGEAAIYIIQAQSTGRKCTV